jgi:hypothetical protein
VALAVLVLGQGGARPAAAQPAESDVGIELVGIVGAGGDPPTLTVLIEPSAPDLTITKMELITHSAPVGQVLHFQWFPPPGTVWHCDRSKVPPEQGQDVQCTVSALAPGSGEGPATQAKCDALPVPFVFDWELSKCKRVVPNSTRVVAGPPTAPDIINTCDISEGPGGPNPYVISDCDLDYEKRLPAGTPPLGHPDFQQAQPWNMVVKESQPGEHTVTERVRIDPEPPTEDLNQANNESEITFVISAAEPHYKCYDLPAGLPPPGTSVNLETQFGTQTLPVLAPTKLCLPAGKNGADPPPGWPDLKCYTIVGQAGGKYVNLETQFGVEKHVTVSQATLLCVPAAMTMMPALPASTEPPPDRHWECYNISGSDPTDVVQLKTKFGTEEVVESGVAVGQATKLCAPALKNGDGTLDPNVVPHLKCYNITGSPPAVPHVNLTTQFGVEANLAVGPPSLLCVPASKEVLGVGGIAELPPLAGTSAEEAGAPAEGSGWSSASYAALAAGLAAAAVALSAGAWYARRRWIR